MSNSDIDVDRVNYWGNQEYKTTFDKGCAINDVQKKTKNSKMWINDREDVPEMICYLYSKQWEHEDEKEKEFLYPG